MKIQILTDSSAVEDFVCRFKKRLAGTDIELPDSVARKIKEIFGKQMTPLEVARRIVSDVESKGDDAVAEYTRKIDGVDLSPADFRVSEAEIKRASSSLSKDLAGAIEEARGSIAWFQERILPERRTVDAGKITMNVVPLASAGVNVPAGEAPHPSTVLMCAVPASVAGVERIVVVTPPGKNGSVNPAILAACSVSGVSEVYRIGGAQAIAALGLGTKTIPQVDKVVGPGNIFVTLAKREIYGRAGIDMLAGPTEVVIVADETARSDFAAADMIAQAEHGPMCAAVLITTSKKVAEAVTNEINKQLKALDRRETAEASLGGCSAIIVVKDRSAALKLADELAPEHLELMMEDAAAAAGDIRNAGAVFVGDYTPETIGDYCAGPSHVLPTGGSARFFSGLSVYDFFRRFSVMQFSRNELKKKADTARRLAKAEGLTGHIRSLDIRFGD